MSFDVDHDDNLYDPVEKCLESNDGANVDVTMIADEDKDRGNIFTDQEGDDRYYTVQEIPESNDGAYVNQTMIAIQVEDGEDVLREQDIDITDVYDVRPVDNKSQNKGEEGGSSPGKTTSGITTNIVNNELYRRFLYDVEKIRDRLPPAKPDASKLDMEKCLESTDGVNVDVTMMADEGKDRSNTFMDQEGDDRYYTVQEIPESNNGAYVNQTMIALQVEDEGNVLREQPESMICNVEKDIDIMDVYDVRPVDNKNQNKGEEIRSSPEKTKSGRTTDIVNNEFYGRFIYDVEKIRDRLPPAIPDASKLDTPFNISMELSQGSANHITKKLGSLAINKESASVMLEEDYSDPSEKDEPSNMNDGKNDNIQERGRSKEHPVNNTQRYSNPIADVKITIVESLPVARTYINKNRLLKVVTAVRTIEPSSFKWLGSLMIIGAFLVLAFEILILCFSCYLQMYTGIWVSGFLLVSGFLQLRLSRNTKTIGSTYIIVTIIALCLSLTALVLGFCLSLVLRVSLTSQICGEIAVLIVYAVSLNLVPVLYSVFYMFTHTFPKSK